MRPSKTDVPVLVLFFNRPDTLKEVFAAVKEAAPATLLLVQDGPREGRPGEVELIQRCRDNVNDIDWECEVYRNYSDINLSCDHREFTAISWAFSHVDRLIILEDDCVPCPSFFPFCAELLERYKDDARVDRICGFNRIEKYEEIASDYLFSTIASGYGWATWKRCWQQIEAQSDYSFLDDPDLVKIYQKSRDIIADRNYGNILKYCASCREKDRQTGKISSWETLVGVNSLINHSLIITPKYNMVRNVGAVPGSTHYADLRYVNSVVKKMLFMDSYDVSFPIKHPKHVMRDANYEKKHNRLIHKSPLQKCIMKVGVLFKRLFSGDFKGISKAIKRRLPGGR